MSANDSAAQPGNSKAKKPRNPMIQFLGLVFVIAAFGLVGMDFKARYDIKCADDALNGRLAQVDKDASSPPVTSVDVKSAVGGKTPDRAEDKVFPNGARRLEVYSWFSLNPVKKRELYVYYGTKGRNESDLPEVIFVQPDDQAVAAAEMPKLTAEQEEELKKARAAGAAMMGGRGGGGGMPPGMGRGGPGGGMMGPPGGRGGRPPRQDAADADKPEADKAVADNTDGEKPAGKTSAEEKKDADKPDSEEPAEDKPAEEKKDER